MKNCGRKTLLLCFQIFLVLWSLSGCAYRSESVIPEAQVSHAIHLLNHIELIWTMDSVYTTQSDFEPAIGAAGDLVCILGDVSFPPKNVVSCIDSMSGNLVWQKSTGAPAGIIVSPEEIIISYDGTKGIDKFDTAGNLIWSHPVTGILYTYVYEDQLQLFMHPERFQALRLDDGALVEEVKNQKVIYTTATERFVKDVNLEARSTDLSQLFWSIEMGNKIRLAPLFTKDFVFFKTGNTMGAVFAVKQTTGQILWQTDANIVSNIVYLSNYEKAVVLTRDGRLLSINAQSGEQETWAEFSDVPFILNGEDIVGGYELAYDKNSQNLYLLLGDSRQLFAFHIQ